MSRVKLFLDVIALALLAVPASAQNSTTGALGGVVMDPRQGVLPGAVIAAVHVPTAPRTKRSPGSTAASTCSTSRSAPTLSRSA